MTVNDPRTPLAAMLLERLPPPPKPAQAHRGGDGGREEHYRT